MVDSPFLSGEGRKRVSCFVVAELRVAAIAAEVYVLCSGCVLLLVESSFVVVKAKRVLHFVSAKVEGCFVGSVL